MARKLTAAQIVAYHRDGFLFIPGFFDPEELATSSSTTRRQALRARIVASSLASMSRP